MSDIGKYASGLAKIVVDLQQAVLIVDGKYRIRYANGFASEFFGYREDELLQYKLHSLVDPEFWLHVRQRIGQLLTEFDENKTKSDALAAVIVRGDGEKVPAQTTLAIIRPEGSKDNEALLRFDTQPKPLIKNSPAEKQLWDATVGFELVHALDMLEDPVVILDDKWLYQFINKAGWRVLSRPKEEVLGHNVWEYRPYLEGTEWQKAAFRAMRTQKTSRIEEFYPKTKQWYVTRFYPTPHSLVCHMENVTTLKETQRINAQLMGSLEDAMEIYWSDENRSRRRDHQKM